MYCCRLTAGTEFFGGKVNISSGLTVFICLLVAVLLLVTVHRWKAGEKPLQLFIYLQLITSSNQSHIVYDLPFNHSV